LELGKEGIIGIDDTKIIEESSEELVNAEDYIQNHQDEVTRMHRVGCMKTEHLPQIII
jgi:hypothetical protein